MEMKGKIQTVLGLIEPSNLGLTLTHEHLIHELDKSVFKLPLPQFLQNIPIQSIDLENVGWIKQYPYCFNENIEFADEPVMRAVVEEMVFFKKSGGGAIVENSSIGLRAKNQSGYLKNLAEKTGVNIIAGTGFYVAGSQTSSTLLLTCENMIDIMKRDIVQGMDENGVRCGIIGEIGCSWPILPFEKQVLVSSAEVQEELHCPVIIHPGRSKQAPEGIIRIFQEAGGKTNQTVMSHLDRTFSEKGDLAEFAKLGCYCEMDLFGIEVSHYQLDENVDMPSDAERISRIRHLVDEGYSDKIVISHDIHTKHRLMAFGGHGYSHILLNVVPKMLRRGISEDIINKILIHNPKTWLTFQ